jgi:hypothetical protein
MEDVSTAQTAQEARQRAQANIAAFDRPGFLTWLRRASEATRAAAEQWPPDRLYRLPGGTACVIEGYQGPRLAVRLLVPGAPGLTISGELLEELPPPEGGGGPPER